MAIPTILQGDTVSRIELTIAKGWDFDGVALDVNICNFTATFVSPVAGETIDLFLTAEDTSLFPLGTHKVTMTLRNNKGDKATLPWAKIKVTDSPAEVLAAAIAVNPSTLKVTDATAADSLGDVKNKLNEVLAFLRKGAVACLAMLPLLTFGAGVASAPLNDIAGNAMVVTDVDLNGLATPADIDGKRDKADLNVYAPKVSPSLDDAALPITWQYGGATYTNAIIDAIVDMGEGVFLSFSAEASGDFGGEAVKVYFDEVGVASSIQRYSSATYFFGGKPYKTGEWPRLKTTAQPTGDTLATTLTVAQIARSVVNTVWDAELGVAWEARMHNGQLYYVAVTNQPPEVK